MELVNLPGGEARRDALRAAGLPRLLMVSPGTRPPLTVDHLEDWIRLPAIDEDVDARVRTLAARRRAALGAVPELDRHTGLLRVAGGSVVLTPLQARLVGVLLERFGAVVPRDALAGAGWPFRTPARSTLDAHLTRLREQLRPLRLALRTVRNRGVRLTWTTVQDGAPG